MTGIYLQTPRIGLRQCRESDRAFLLDLDSDPEVMKYLTSGQPSSEESVDAAMGRILALKAKFEGRLGFYIAEMIESGEPIGWFHLRPDKKDPENFEQLELGYRLKKRVWGQGIATEVSMALVERAFLECAAQTVFAQTFKANLASARVMQKIGMSFEREFTDLEHPGEILVRYGINREQWFDCL